MTQVNEKTKAYTYKRYMRDGTMKEMHAVARSKKSEKQNAKS